MSHRYQGGFITASYNGLKTPGAPTIGTATSGSGSATIAFTAPSDIGGSAITNYVVLSSPGGVVGTGTSSPITVTGLTNDTPYTFTVFANNVYGNSPASSASNSVTPANVTTSVEILVVAGGGTGGIITNIRGAGGGAGGLIYISSFPTAVGAYTVTVGSGGASASGSAAAKGNNSVFTGAGRTLTALGGGFGGYDDNTNNGATGGSGGGQWYPGYTGAAATQPSTTSDGISTYSSSGFGNKGGDSSGTPPYGSGGGGAGAAGANWNTSGGPVGGVGKQYSISGTATYYAGGGGADNYPPAYPPSHFAGGLGGGGAGYNDAYNILSNATANTGGGGGAGGSGGSGIVILRYPDSYIAATSTTGSPTITVSGGYRIYQFTSSGSITF